MIVYMLMAGYMSESTTIAVFSSEELANAAVKKIMNEDPGRPLDPDYLEVVPMVVDELYGKKFTVSGEYMEMKKYTVSKDTKIVLEGRMFMLEQGDIIAING